MDPSRSGFQKKLLASAVASIVAGGAYAEEAEIIEEIVVVGIRGSLERAMDLKRDSHGVVDAITAQDIGKFPDTNLAESLQRITGVSIDRVNGEGSEVTVRGFGGGFNLVTLNGRHMPTANVVVNGGDQQGDFAEGTSRSFDFSNLASEGVTGIVVYKTGRAASPSGGIGATIDIRTLRPLDSPNAASTIGAKAVYDTSVIDGDEVKPEASGLFSWANSAETFGVSLFGSLQERDFTTRSATVNGWNIRVMGPGVLDSLGMQNAAITNVPNEGQLLALPNDSRYHLSESERERVNGQLTLQFRPMETLTFTADATYAENSQEELRLDQTNWFNRTFTEVQFDGDPEVATPVFLAEVIDGVKDAGFEQQLRAMEDTLESFGFNAEWQVNDRLSVSFDAHSSEAASEPDGPFGASSVLVSVGAPVITAHSLDLRSGFPVQSIVIDDALRGNGNGVLDVGDLGTQVARVITSTQRAETDQARLDGTWDFEGGRIDAGLDYRSTEMTQRNTQTQMVLGDWGISNPGDVPADLVEAFCLTCEFEQEDPEGSGASLVNFQGNAADMLEVLAPLYGGMGEFDVTEQNDNLVEEDIWAAYFQITLEGELAGFPTTTVLGVRYEETDVTSTSLIGIPEAVVWQSDNDFSVRVSDQDLPVSRDGRYTNLLPSADFSIELLDDFIARFSFSETIARPDYSDLFVSETANSPPRPTALGGVAGGSTGNADLLPLESRNFDLSLEWYYGDASYLSVGFYEKRVKNFIGTGQETRNLFDLRDPSSGTPGTRSAAAIAALEGLGLETSEVNLFTMTAVLDNPQDFPNGAADFVANDQAFVDEVLARYDIVADGNDPLFDFEVQFPNNARDAKIHGFEIAHQHFFGDTGFGYQANVTTVSGDVGFDEASPPGVDQFALEGLSDSVNVVAIYEKYGISARLAYNWRDTFLRDVNRAEGTDRNPTIVDDYGQLDLNVSYQVTDSLMVTFEAINLTESTLEHYGRKDKQLWFVQELDRRFLLGARYRF